MSFDTNYYSKYAKNIFTQNGDDGVIEKLFEDLKITDGIVVEFGAWDGIYLSNVYNLWRYKKFNAILIEGDESKANEMLNLVESFDNVECMNCFVSPYENDQYCLDNLLKQSDFEVSNDNLSLVSIDVDSYDYHIFNSLTEFFPKVIIIETKTFPFGEDMYKEYCDFGMGCSIKSVNDLGIEKGYKLVCHNGNAYFVRNDLVNLLPKDVDFSFENLHCYDTDVDIWQSLDQDGNKLEGKRYYLENEYQSFLNSEKEKCKTLI